MNISYICMYNTYYISTYLLFTNIICYFFFLLLSAVRMWRNPGATTRPRRRPALRAAPVTPPPPLPHKEAANSPTATPRSRRRRLRHRRPPGRRRRRCRRWSPDGPSCTAAGTGSCFLPRPPFGRFKIDNLKKTFLPISWLEASAFTDSRELFFPKFFN